MNLSGVPASPNFEDRTNFINRRSSLADVYYPHNSLTGDAPPVIPYSQLTPHERGLVNNGGFTVADIILMRATGASPDMIMRGWNLQDRVRWQQGQTK